MRNLFPQRKEVVMEQVILPPDEEWVAYIAKMLILGDEISMDVIGEKMDGSLDDLERIQKIIDSNKIPTENTQELQSLGILFGKIFVNQATEYDWWIVEDDDGRDVCIRYKRTSLKIFPRTVISKRIEDSKEVNVPELFHNLKSHLAEIEPKMFSH